MTGGVEQTDDKAIAEEITPALKPNALDASYSLSDLLGVATAAH